MFEKKTEQGVNEQAIEYLEQKYREKFEYKAPAGASYSGTRTFLATCESFGANPILVQIENYKDREKMIIRDNYIAVKYKDKITEFLAQIANEEFGSSKIYYSVSGRVLSEELSCNAGSEDYFACTDGLISAVISLPESGYKNNDQFKLLATKITNTLSCNEISILMVVVNEETFKSADEKELREIFLEESGVAQARFERYNGDATLEYLGEG